MSKSRRKRVRARERARGDRVPLPAPRTGKGPLYNWAEAGVRDLVDLQRAIATGRLPPSDKARGIVALVLKLFDEGSGATESEQIEAFRALAIATGRADLRRRGRDNQ